MNTPGLQEDIIDGPLTGTTHSVVMVLYNQHIVQLGHLPLRGVDRGAAERHGSNTGAGRDNMRMVSSVER